MRAVIAFTGATASIPIKASDGFLAAILDGLPKKIFVHYDLDFIPVRQYKMNRSMGLNVWVSSPNASRCFQLIDEYIILL